MEVDDGPQTLFDKPLESVPVIPYAKDIAEFINRRGALPIASRRAFKRVLALIKTIALIHQKHRRRDEQGRFISDYSDYAIVYQLLEESFAESLGKLKRYTDDRIRLIENIGMITPRDLAERTGVSTAAISQWLKPLIEKGVLNWCDETGIDFVDDLTLEKAKRSGKAYLSVAGGNSLPSLFQLTGDFRWDRGGDLYAAYDLALGDGCDDSDQAFAVTENIINLAVEKCEAGDNQENDEVGVKVLREKTNDDIKKMMETFRENQSTRDVDNSIGDQLFHEFSEILSTERVDVVH